ncbi:hypothetical protein [Rhizobium sp. AQ_MP]|nr:hypothetical protein [Rhizobium sp. AQ_MP]
MKDHQPMVMKRPRIFMRTILRVVTMFRQGVAFHSGDNIHAIW